MELISGGEHNNQYAYNYIQYNDDGTKTKMTGYVPRNTVESSAVDRNAENYTVAAGYCYIGNGDDRVYYKTEVWDHAPSAGFTSGNGVTWDMSDAGVLADKTIYTLEFDVWPSQDAYDLLANLRNGLKQLTELDDATLEQLDITTRSRRRFRPIRTPWIITS